MTNKGPKQIDFSKIMREIKRNGRIYLVILPITFVLSCLLIISIPRYYGCEVTMAPELSNSSSLGSMAGLASSFGIDLAGSLHSEDAISPNLYPDLVTSTDFVVSLFPVEVVTKDGKKETYYEHLKNQKAAWWVMGFNLIKKCFQDADTVRFTGREPVNSFMLTKSQQDIVKIMGGKIKCSVDKKTDVISVYVEDQDPIVCAAMADSVRVRLQDFITEYRTKKACHDLAQVKKLYQEAKASYEKARQIYGSYADKNQDLVLESYRSKQEDLENDMQLRYNIYSGLVSQMQAAQAKVQERTPAFTTLKCATVPLKPAGPKRMLFVAAMTILAFLLTTVYKYSTNVED